MVFIFRTTNIDLPVPILVSFEIIQLFNRGFERCHIDSYRRAGATKVLDVTGSETAVNCCTAGVPAVNPCALVVGCNVT